MRIARWFLRSAWAALLAVLAVLSDVAAVGIGMLAIVAVAVVALWVLLVMGSLLLLGWSLWPYAWPGSVLRNPYGLERDEPAEVWPADDRAGDSAPGGVATPAVADVAEAMNSLSLAELNEANRQARPGIRRLMPWPGPPAKWPDPPAKGTH